MRSTKRLALAALTVLATLALGATTGCTGSGLRPDTAASDDDLRELKTRIVELQRKAAVSEVEIARLREEVAALQSARGGARSAAAPSSGMPSTSSTSTRIAAAPPSTSSRP